MKINGLTHKNLVLTDQELADLLASLPADRVRDAVSKSGHTAEILRFAPDQDVLKAWHDREPSIGLLGQLSAITMDKLNQKAGGGKVKALEVVA